jgi:ribosomal protein S18 acetylase RimI-like enzyme
MRLLLLPKTSNDKTSAVAITLEVPSTNVVAQELYNKAGFLPDAFVTFTKNI